MRVSTAGEPDVQTLLFVALYQYAFREDVSEHAMGARLN